MEPAQDPFYRLHQLQAERSGKAALPYEQFRATLVKTDSANLNLLLMPHVDAKRKPEMTAKTRFNLGLLCIREDVAAVVPADEILNAVECHAAGDCGLEKDQGGVEWALRRSGWILSAFRSSEGKKFYIVTMPDRAMTVVLFYNGDE